jgi:hypothetical protein
MEVLPVTRRSLIIIDDFYPDPDGVRAVALRADFSVKGNYPGLRTRPTVRLISRASSAARPGSKRANPSSIE